MTLTASEQIRRRFGNQRPGLELLGLVEAALPVTVLRLDVLAQERKQLPLLDEFIIRFIHEGVEDIKELAELLGLEREQVLNATAELRQLPVPFDRLTWSVENYPQITLVRKKEAEDLGYLLLPAKKHSPVTLADLTVERFNQILVAGMTTTGSSRSLESEKSPPKTSSSTSQ